MRFTFIVLSVLCFFTIFFACNFAASLDGQTDEQQEIYQEILRRDGTRQLLVQRLQLTLKWLSNHDSNLSRSDRNYLNSKVNELSKVIAKMPTAVLSDSELEEFAGLVAKKTGQSKKDAMRLIEKKLKDYYLQNFDAPINLNKQWKLVHRILNEIDQNTETGKHIVAAFNWQLVGDTKGFAVLLNQKTFADSIGLSSDQIEKFQVGIKELEAEFKKQQAAHSRTAIKQILSVLKKSQIEKLVKRLSISEENIPELYDKCTAETLSYILKGKPKKVRCLSPLVVYQRIPPGTKERTDVPINRSLLKDISKWSKAPIERWRNDLGSVD